MLPWNFLQILWENRWLEAMFWYNLTSLVLGSVVEQWDRLWYGSRLINLSSNLTLLSRLLPNPSHGWKYCIIKPEDERFLTRVCTQEFFSFVVIDFSSFFTTSFFHSLPPRYFSSSFYFMCHAGMTVRGMEAEIYISASLPPCVCVCLRERGFLTPPPLTVVHPDPPSHPLTSMYD